MYPRQLSSLILALLLPLMSLFGQDQDVVTVTGVIKDADTDSLIPFATVAAPDVSRGTIADINGFYKIELPPEATLLKFTYVGYQEKTVQLGKGKQQVINVYMKSSETTIKEVTVRSGKYRNKDNPAVALIKKVIEHRDENRLEELDYYSEKQYEKTMLGLSKMPTKLKDRKILNDAKFLFENRDTSKIANTSVIPFMLQENMIDLYSKNPPGIVRKYITATQAVKFPDYLDDVGISQALQYLNQDINLYDNYIVLLTDHFLSPIANNAPLFYRYYPQDTIIEHGRKVVVLEFYPRNKTDMLLQGELYVALDSTYPVTKAIFGVNPNINLNWVRHLTLRQDFEMLPSGKWYLSEEDYKMDFGITRKSIGIYGERVLRHTDPEVNVPLPDSVFAPPDEVVYLPGSEITDTSYWHEARPVTLSDAELSTYENMDSLQRTKLFKRTATLLDMAIIGYAPAGKNFEIGPLATFYSFNQVEGQRLRFGMRTTSDLSKHIRLSALGGYGFMDQEWKFRLGADIAMPGTEFNTFPVKRIRIKYDKDLIIPGYQLYQSGSNTFLTSFVRGVNDKFLYTDKLTLEFEREFHNHFSYNVGTEREVMSPAGALHFDPTDNDVQRDAPLTVSRFFLQFRYAPGEKFYQSQAYRQIIDYRWIFLTRYTLGVQGAYGGDYGFHQVNVGVRKFSNTPPFGYNTIWLEAGANFNKVPWPMLTIHRANQSYVYDQFSYNLMNFMEFISDRYVAFNIDHSFYGFFLNKIPLMRKLKLREYATLKVIYGTVTPLNRPTEDSGLFYFPTEDDGTPISHTLMDKPYIEASVGVGNIFKVLRIDLVRRFSYLDNPNAPEFGIRGRIDLSF